MVLLSCEGLLYSSWHWTLASTVIYSVKLLICITFLSHNSLHYNLIIFLCENSPCTMLLRRKCYSLYETPLHKTLSRHNILYAQNSHHVRTSPKVILPQRSLQSYVSSAHTSDSLPYKTPPPPLYCLVPTTNQYSVLTTPPHYNVYSATLMTMYLTTPHQKISLPPQHISQSRSCVPHH